MNDALTDLTCGDSGFPLVCKKSQEPHDTSKRKLRKMNYCPSDPHQLAVLRFVVSQLLSQRRCPTKPLAVFPVKLWPPRRVLHIPHPPTPNLTPLCPPSLSSRNYTLPS